MLTTHKPCTPFLSILASTHLQPITLSGLSQANLHRKSGTLLLQVLAGKFGAATNAINGDLECHGKNIQQAKDRFNIYKKVLPALGINEAPRETGCYN